MENNQQKVLEVKNLRISFKTNTGTVKAVRGIDFNLYKGKTLAIVGESGSGKSVTSKAILGILANNKIIEGGQIIFDGKDLLRLEEEKFTQIRGVKISMIFQDPLSSLNPIMRVGKQLTEAMYLKSQASTKEAKNTLAKINKVFAKFIDKQELKNFHDSISAMNKTDGQVAENLNKFVKLFETALTNELVEHKNHLNELLNSVKTYKDTYFKGDSFDVKGAQKALKNLTKVIKNAKFTLEFAPDDIVEVFPVSLGEYLTAYNASVKMVEDRKVLLEKNNATSIYDLSPAIRAKEREVIVEPQEIYGDIVALMDRLIAHVTALVNDPNLSTAALLMPLVSFYARNLTASATSMTEEQAKQRALQLLKEVGINDAERRYYQYPFEFSGGMRQRIVIAIALSSNPEVLICDEPTTALDVTIQAQILELINKLKAEKNLSIIFITHDLGVVANMADDIAVMYAGKIVEYGTVYDIFYDPRHPYTWALLGSMPDLDTKDKLEAIPGTPPNMLLPPKGDAFADRNKYALQIDYEERPPFFSVSDTHAAATWLLDEYAPDVEAPQIVRDRIFNSLAKNPQNMPSFTNDKNSILKKLKK